MVSRVSGTPDAFASLRRRAKTPSYSSAVNRPGMYPDDRRSFMNTKKNYIERSLNNIKFNSIRHQYKNSECGVYSINFILRLLKGESFEHICNNITKDDEVNECRPVYFRFK